jgi:sodium/proline symporter
MALSVLFIELFPGWLAALIGIGILAAVMSTADGLVVSSSQIIANDLYRCTFVPRFAADLPEAVVDRRVLIISRFATVGVMLVCTAMAWALADRNVALIVWVGTGGMMAAFAGPLVLGSIWRGITKAGAFAGLLGGVVVFSITHGALIDPGWFVAGWLHDVALWLLAEAPNPWSCAAMGEIVSIALTWAVSKVTRPLPEAHVDKMFGALIEK